MENIILTIVVLSYALVVVLTLIFAAPDGRDDERS